MPSEKTTQQSASRHPLTKQVPIFLVLTTFVFILFVTVIYDVWKDRSTHLHNTQLALKTRSQLFGEHVANRLLLTSSVLKFLENDINENRELRQIAPPEHHHSLLPQNDKLYALYNAHCETEEVNAIISTSILQQGEKICQSLRNSNKKEQLEQAVQLSPVEHLLFTRKLTSRDGAFTGVLMHILRFKDILNPLLNANSEHADVIVLFGPNQKQLAAWQRSGVILNSHEYNDIFISKKGQEKSNKERFLTYLYSLKEFPLQVGMGIDKERALALWRSNATRDITAVSIIACVFTFIGFAIKQQQRRRMLVEQELLKSEARYRAVAEHFPDGAIMLFDSSMRCVLANGSGLARFSFASKQIQGQMPQDFLPVHAVHPFEQLLRQALSGIEGMETLPIQNRTFEAHCTPIGRDGESKQCVVLLQDVTLREQNQKALRDSAFRLNEAQRIARIGSFRTDCKQKTVSWSDEMYRLVGLPTSARPLSLQELFEECAPNELPWLHSVLSTRETRHVAMVRHAFPYQLRTGKRGYARLQLHLDYDANGTPECAYGTFQDITEMHEAALALRQREQELNAALHIAHMAQFRYDHSTGVIYPSGAMLQLLNIPELDNTTPQTRIRELVPELIPIIEHAVIANASEEQTEGYNAPISFSTLLGESRHGHVHLRIISDPYNAPLITNGVIQDTSDFVSIEQALRRSEATYRTLTDHLPNGIVILIDAKETIHVATGQALKDLQLSIRPNVTMLKECFSKEVYTTIQTLIHKARQDGSAQKELNITEKYFDATVLPIPDVETEGTIMLLLQDATQRRKWAKGLRAAKEAAEAANEIKSQFVANISHEMRTPLSGILGIIDVALAARQKPEQQHRYLRVIQNVAEDLLVVINDLLDFSRLEAGRMPLELRSYFLVDIINEALEPLRVQATKKHLDLCCTTQPNCPQQLFGDPFRLKQILINLVGNALKFTEQGGVLLEISCQLDKQNNTVLHFAVHDTGPGIPEDKHSQLFESFSQADGSYSRRHTGSGLGLAISRQLVTLLGGTIGVISHEGEGSCFWFTLPILHPVEQSVSETATPLPHKSDTRPLTILLAEDNDLNREFLTIFLEEKGHTVFTATNGLEALELLDAYAIDLVLMDVQMPKMNGLEAVQRIRASEKAWSTIPVIALTAHSMLGDRNKCLEQGMNDFVTKPVKKELLFAAIARHTPTGA